LRTISLEMSRISTLKTTISPGVWPIAASINSSIGLASAPAIAGILSYFAAFVTLQSARARVIALAPGALGRITLIEKTKFQTKMENVLKENDRLLTQALSVEIVNIVVHDCMNRDTVSSSESAPTFAELFEINELQAQVQEKDTVILKLKEKLKSFCGDVKERKVERDVEEIETLNLELDHKVTKLAAENNHLKQTYKQLFDSIKSSRVQSKEQCDDLYLLKLYP
nr:pyruvate, phosphate dikinase regulatory protein, chloroplastic [Tanacetum cinerariifolium]